MRRRLRGVAVLRARLPVPAVPGRRFGMGVATRRMVARWRGVGVRGGRPLRKGLWQCFGQSYTAGESEFVDEHVEIFGKWMYFREFCFTAEDIGVGVVEDVRIGIDEEREDLVFAVDVYVEKLLFGPHGADAVAIGFGDD